MKKTFSLLWASVFLLFVSSLACAEVQPPLVTKGVDLSHFNGEVDWTVLKKNSEEVQFVVLKATEGVDYLDPMFKEHWKAAGEQKLLRGAYHFFVAHDDPIEEAQWYIKNVPLTSGDIYPIVDVERAKKNDKPGLKKRLSVFLKKIEEHFGVPPIVYTGSNFWNTYINGKIHSGHLWIAQYKVDKPVIPEGWDQWTFWQYTQAAKVVGIEKPVDMNLFSGTSKNLEKLCLP